MVGNITPLLLAALVGFCYGANFTPMLRSEYREGKIVGGESIDITEAPYQVSLQVKRFGHSCGGAIISEYLILTAAHCVKGSDVDNMQIRAGSKYTSEEGQLINVQKAIVHESFTFFTLDYDVALLKLEKPLIFGPTVKPISVIAKNFKFNEGLAAKVTGWGVTEEGGDKPDILQKVIVPLINHKKCIKAYEHFQAVTIRMICAGLAQGGKDACQGDSGGPFVVQGKLAGVVSWGNGCARPDYPGIYTRLSVLTEWIDENSKSLMKEEDVSIEGPIF